MNKISRRDWFGKGFAAASVLAFSNGNLFSQTPAPGESFLKNPVRLTSNENLYGFSARAKRALLASVELGNRYADRGNIAELEKTIAEREGLQPENVILGSGSGEVLCMAGAAYGLNGGEIVAPDPTFPLLFAYAENFGARIEKIPLDEKFEHDFSEMEKRISPRTSLVFVCHPNNPTGTISQTKSVGKFCEEASRKTIVFVDEAYLEYTREFPKNSMVDLVRRNKNVIVSRTFSKIYGLAGIRVGYGLAKKEIADRLKKFRMTWFNSPGIEAAGAAYGDTDFIRMSREKNIGVREFVSKSLTEMNFYHPASYGNFLWVKFGAKSRDLAERMLPAGLLVRAAPPPYEDWARITIGTSEQMKVFIKVLQKNA